MKVVLYDMWQRVRGHEWTVDYTSYFCSELAARALERAGVVQALDTSLVSPSDLCRWAIYDHTYHYLKKPGEADPNPREVPGIPRFNMLPPGGY
jgi:hypothetical protein